MDIVQINVHSVCLFLFKWRLLHFSTEVSHDESIKIISLASEALQNIPASKLSHCLCTSFNWIQCGIFLLDVTRIGVYFMPYINKHV